MWPWGKHRSELHCERCRYLLKGLSRRGNCPECGTPIHHSIVAHRRRLRHQTPEHTPLLAWVAGIYALVNVLAGVFSRAELLPIFVVVGPALLGVTVLAAQTVNAPRPFHWRAVAGLGLFLVAAAVGSHVVLRMA
jgi:hypothetical protein